MEAPDPIIIKEETPKEIDKIKEEFNAEIKSENSNNLQISIKNHSSYISISSLNKNEFLKTEFEKKYNFRELTKIKYLAGFDSIDDIFEQLKYEFQKKNLKINEENDLIKIIIPIDLIKIKEIISNCPKKLKMKMKSLMF